MFKNYILESTVDKFLYHGTIKVGIRLFKTNKRSCPENNMKSAIYATDIPSLAVGFSFLWESSEGFDINYSDGVTTLIVPKKQVSRLMVKIYVYRFLSSDFNASTFAPVGHNFISYNSVKPVGVPMTFNSVYDGMSYYGGKIVEI